MVRSQPFRESVALVTGASSGIGKATAEALAQAGSDVALIARREDRLRSIATEIESEYDSNTLVVPADVTNSDQISLAVETIIKSFQKIDVVVNNAGVTAGDNTPISEIDQEDYEMINSVNIDGSFYISKNTMKPLAQTSGNLIFVGSFDGHFPRPQNPVYTASKWWLRGFAHSLAGQAGRQGIGITIVNPAKVRTEIGIEGEPSFKKKYDPGEVLEPADVADAIVFACQQEQHVTVSELDLYTRDKYSREGF